MFFNAVPVPRTTARSGSSAMWTRSFVFAAILLSRPRNRAPPPVSQIPLPRMSALSSGGDCSSARNTASSDLSLSMASFSRACYKFLPIILPINTTYNSPKIQNKISFGELWIISPNYSTKTKRFVLSLHLRFGNFIKLHLYQSRIRPQLIPKLVRE